MAVKFRLKNNIPKKLFDVPKGEQAREDAQDDLAIEALQLFEKTTATWEHKPSFELRLARAGWSISTRSKIYGYVDTGTRAHPITPRGPGPPVFTRGGAAQTRPRRLSSSPGKRGTVWVSARAVAHPGTEPREFSIIIQERIQKKLVPRFKRVLKEYHAK